MTTAAPDPTPGLHGRAVPDAGLHGRPTATELVEAVREWLQQDVMSATSGRLQFHTRVAVNMLAMVERELAVWAGQELEHRQRLAALGMADDAELAAAIRSGVLDHRYREVKAAVTADVLAKLAVANPSYDTGASGTGASGTGASGTG